MAVSVLIVEDDRNIAELLQMYLEKEGYAVTVAADGGQGLQKFRDVVIIFHNQNRNSHSYLPPFSHWLSIFSIISKNPGFG